MDMNSLFLIGNGFDLSLGIPTDYQSFYKYYLVTESPSNVIKKLKEIISPDDINWSDLEEAIGNLDIFEDEASYLECVRDIRVNLRQYLMKVIESQKGVIQIPEMSRCLSEPESYLTDKKSSEFIDFRDGFEHCHVYAISFNYTDLFENQINPNMKAQSSSSATYEETVHVHGTLAKEMTFGVNDISQIKIPGFRNSEDIVEEIVKPEYNDACENLNNTICEELIEVSNLFVLFGVSLGRTDEKWWKLIGNQINSRQDARVMYFPFDKSIDLSVDWNKRRRVNMQYTNNFCERAGITDENKSKVFTNVNSNIFASRVMILP